MKVNFDIEEVKYIKIVIPKNDSSSSVTVRAAIKDINEKEFIACTKFDKNLKLVAPQEIVVSFISDDGIYRTKTTLQSFKNGRSYTYLTLETPDNIEYHQNREYFRVPMVCNCEYKVLIKEEPVKFTTKTIDISASGVSLYTSELLISNAGAELVININNKKLKIKARYIRSERFGDGYKISFAYTNILESDRDIISQACIAKQLEEKRNKLI